MALPASLVLVGAGKMGGAMLEGWLALGLPPAAVTALDPAPSDEMKALAAARGFALNPPAGTVAPPETLVLAVKPQMLDAAAPSIAPLVGPGTLIVSVMAGKTIADIKARLPASAVVRAMPNTPAAVGRGVAALVAGPGVSSAQRDVATALLGAVGRVEWLDDEALIDAVTAVSGSGPAYVFLLAETLAKAGEAAGLPAGLSARLARATVEGAGELLFRAADVAPSRLRENVTSPAGTTAAALAVLMAGDGLQPLMTRAVAAAKRRAEELSG
ncbi:MAG: pyrroline-5-carboxylate reductase [Methylobacteriaceae bacterium]|nr:pyrroline-5-carboxylate reductase [Methylobacteriaceae bacterium]